MNRSELLTRASVWLAVSGYAIGVGLILLARGRREWLLTARLVWTIGCVAMIVHIGFAFHFYHGWSHTAAYVETARQTSDVVGIDWGGGVWINYAFVALWAFDAGSWWWNGIEAHRCRYWLLSATWQFLLVFMFFNALVVFESGVMRWLGVAIFLSLGWLWWVRRRL